MNTFLKLSLALLLLLAPAAARAIMAYPGPVEVTQPDGSVLTLRAHGDEYFHWTSTVDGYRIVRSEAGAWVYADRTDIAAHNPEARSAVELEAVATLSTGAPASMRSEGAQRRLAAGQQKIVMKDWDFDKFRGLVILVEFSDRKFSRADAADLFNEMINAPDYKGYTDLNGFVNYTGSVHDYFRDNSLGNFCPEFDVVGPVTIPYSQTAPSGTSAAQTVINAAITAAAPQIDFTRYDANGDQVVDMIYFIFAGHGSNFGGNNSRLLWPHASSVWGMAPIGKMFMGRYACSTEFYGPESQAIIDGIGTICHEFSHIIGLADEYDTDYEGSGGQSFDPGEWSVMSGGSYNNYGRTPCGYSIFQRYQCGFARPVTVTEAADFTLGPVLTSNTGVRIDTPQPKEFFLLENRQKESWDSYLPGHGLLVWRVDSTDSRPWDRNQVNANPKHNYYELVRAKPAQGQQSAGDPFPGSGGITYIDNETTPSLRSWAGLNCEYLISDITETPDGEVSFKVMPDNFLLDTEDFDLLSATEDSNGFTGKFTTWTLGGKAEFVDADAENLLSGTRGLAIWRGGSAATAPLPMDVMKVSFDIYNPNATSPTVYLRYSDDGGATWHIVPAIDGKSAVKVGGNTKLTAVYRPLLPTGCLLQLYFHTGSSLKPVYIDNFAIYHRQAISGIDDVVADTAATRLAVSRTESGIMVSGAAPGAPVRLISLSGATLAIATAADDGTAAISAPALPRGVYIVASAGRAAKVVL